MFDVWACIIFGLLGYWMKERNWPSAPLVLGFILGPLIEESARQSIELAGGSISYVLGHPIAIALFCASILSLFVSMRLMNKTATTAT